MILGRIIITGAAVMTLAAGLEAQTTTTKATEPGASTSTTTSITGEVVLVERNWLLTKILPNGGYRWFNVQPGRQFTIDGQTRLIADLKPGTVLTAVVITKTQPVTVRTTSVLNGTVWYVSGNYVVLTLENGENRELQRSRIVPVHGREQTGVGQGTEEGHEGLGHENRLGAPD